MKVAADARVKPIVARNQVSLGARRCLQLALSGMSYRMFRSGITVAILALAVAFVAHMLSFGLMQRSTEHGAYLELQQSRRLGQDLGRLISSDTDLVVLRALAENDEARLREYQGWTKASAAELAHLKLLAQRVRACERFLEDLPMAARAVIVGDQSPPEVFNRLADSEQMSLLETQLQQLAISPPLDDMAAFRRFIFEQRPRLLSWTHQAIAGHRRAIDQLADGHDGKPFAMRLAEADQGLSRDLSAVGFAFGVARVGALKAVARRIGDEKTISRLLLNEAIAKGVARGARLELGDVNFASIAEYVDNDDRAAWFAQLLASANGPKYLDAPRISELTRRFRRERKLTGAVGDYDPAAGRGLLGLSERDQWLIILSFLVCAVGVANAMLMSVTERFTEIATMKCLGALDGFVMMMFVFEAIVQGLVGGILGLILGGSLAFLRAVVDYGTLSWSAGAALGQIGIAMLVSLTVGILLAAGAAVGPAWLASRLAPMEAMRVE